VDLLAFVPPWAFESRDQAKQDADATIPRRIAGGDDEISRGIEDSKMAATERSDAATGAGEATA
jgi:hypothetical protein